jgi:hypothetical protein
MKLSKRKSRATDGKKNRSKELKSKRTKSMKAARQDTINKRVGKDLKENRKMLDKLKNKLLKENSNHFKYSIKSSVKSSPITNVDTYENEREVRTWLEEYKNLPDAESKAILSKEFKKKFGDHIQYYLNFFLAPSQKIHDYE